MTMFALSSTSSSDLLVLLLLSLFANSAAYLLPSSVEAGEDVSANYDYEYYDSGDMTYIDYLYRAPTDHLQDDTTDNKPTGKHFEGAWEDEENLPTYPRLLEPRPMSKTMFLDKVKNVRTFPDFLRIFYGSDVPREQLEQLITNSKVWSTKFEIKDSSSRLKRNVEDLVAERNEQTRGGTHYGALKKMKDISEKETKRNHLDKDEPAEKNVFKEGQKIIEDQEKREIIKEPSLTTIQPTVDDPVSVASFIRTEDIELATVVRDLDEPLRRGTYITTNFSCSKPQPRTFKVSQFYTSHHTDYFPICVVLHRCQRQSGCCEQNDEECSVLQYEDVNIKFYALKVIFKSSAEEIVNIAEMPPEIPVDLMFRNHTQCGCRKKNVLPILSHCKMWCPNLFTLRVHPQGTCHCDCFDEQEDCLLVKKGLKPLDYGSISCIEDGECDVPTCTFGDYNRINHRCPKPPLNARMRSLYKIG